MAIRTLYSDTGVQTYTISGSITGGTLIRYTVLGVNTTVSILTTDTVAILALLNSLNIGTFYYSAGTYTSYTCTVSLLGFRIDTGAGNNDVTFIGSLNDYLRDYEALSNAIELETESINPPFQRLALNYGTCPCSCDFIEKVFGGDSEDNLYESDRTSYLFRAYLVGDGFDLALYKNGGSTPIVLDADVCDFYDFGDLERNGTADPNYSGFLIHWFRVLANEGYGTYQIKGTETIAGVEYVYESHAFALCAYNSGIAKGTVKIESTQNGYIESEDINWTGLTVPGKSPGWYQSVRVDGKLTKLIPKLIQDSFVNQSFVETQIQDSLLDQWQLELRPLPAQITDFLVYNASLANQTLISDYNVNPSVYSQQNLRITEISELKSWSGNTNVRGTFKLEDRIKDKRKRNYI